MERSRLSLRNLLYLSVKLRSGCLINTGLLGQTENTASLKNSQNTECINITRVLRSIKRNLNMALCCQVIDLIRLNNINDTNQTGRIGQIAIMQNNRSCFDQMINARGIRNRCTADNSVNLISLLQQKFCQIRTILTCDTGNKCFFHFPFSPLVFYFFFPLSFSFCFMSRHFLCSFHSK